MELPVARERVIECGKKLLQSGLIARTWGNVSCRLSDSHFVVTPSGRSYENLRPEEIVIANICDENIWGDVLPSTEIGIHREVYRHRLDAGFAIHTHQFEASIFSVLDCELEAEDFPVFGGKVPCALYGLPGSDTLRRRVAAAMDATPGNAVLMAHHGALLIGENDEDSFRQALALEVVAARRIAAEYFHVTGCEMQSQDSLYEYFFDRFREQTIANHFFHSERTEKGFIIYGKDGASEFDFDAEKMPFVAQALRTIYLARPDISCIVQGIGGASLTLSVLGEELPVYLDDFAQICGLGVTCAGEDPDAVVAALAQNHVVFVANSGAFCCGATLKDATACAIIAEKNGRAHFVSQLFGVSHQLHDDDAAFLRDFYLTKYSKRF